LLLPKLFSYLNRVCNPICRAVAPTGPSFLRCWVNDLFNFHLACYCQNCSATLIEFVTPICRAVAPTDPSFLKLFGHQLIFCFHLACIKINILTFTLFANLYSNLTSTDLWVKYYFLFWKYAFIVCHLQTTK